MKNQTSLRLVLSALALSSFCGAGAAQQPSTNQSMTTIKVQSREVLLPVTVIDKHGALVTNLKAGDFTLTEDGRAQTIKSFTTQSNLPSSLGCWWTQAAASTPRWTASAKPRRNSST